MSRSQPANNVLQETIGYLLKRPIGRFAIEVRPRQLQLSGALRAIKSFFVLFVPSWFKTSSLRLCVSCA